MKIGTKSVLIGAHCFFIHPWFVAAAWWKLYGFPYGPRLWVAFFVHDLGPEGEQHPYWGAFVMGALFGQKWFKFTLYHSRFLAKKEGAHFSRLCVADKLAIVLEPAWLYLPRVSFTGEIIEYMKDAERNSNGKIPLQKSRKAWYLAVQDYVAKWVEEHKDERPDSWTPDRRHSVSGTGVWQ